MDTTSYIIFEKNYHILAKNFGYWLHLRARDVLIWQTLTFFICSYGGITALVTSPLDSILFFLKNKISTYDGEKHFSIKEFQNLFHKTDTFISKEVHCEAVRK